MQDKVQTEQKTQENQTAKQQNKSSKKAEKTVSIHKEGAVHRNTGSPPPETKEGQKPPVKAGQKIVQTKQGQKPAYKAKHCATVC